MRERPLRDPGMNNTVASIVLVPDGWKLEGGLTRPAAQLYNMPVILDVKVGAPDGRAVHFFPGWSFEFNHQMPGQPLQPTADGNLFLHLPSSPGQWFLDMARRSPAPGVSQLRLVSEKPLPEPTEQLRRQSAPLFQMAQQTNASTAALGFALSFDTQATQFVLSYQENGKALEETVIIAWQYLIRVQQGQPVSGNWSINLMTSFRGPAGTDYVNDPVLAAIVKSVRVNPAWDAEMQRYWQELARIRQQGANDRAASWQAHNRKMQQLRGEINDIIVGGYRERSAIQEQGHARTVDMINQETAYSTPSGATVKLPSFYDHVYTDSNGTYVLNNDAFYDPNRDPALNGANWSRLSPSR